jgi:DNA-binding NtrC family response regulator
MRRSRGRNLKPAGYRRAQTMDERRGLDDPERILIIDDDETIRKTLAAILEEQGYTVDTARNGSDAVRQSRSHVYNVALIDIRLPDMKGTALLTIMKNTAPRMRTIIITGHPSLRNAVEALNRGADGYILKPFDPAQILRMIKEQLKSQKEDAQYSQGRVAEFIETRARELERN